MAADAIFAGPRGKPVSKLPAEAIEMRTKTTANIIFLVSSLDAKVPPFPFLVYLCRAPWGQ